MSRGDEQNGDDARKEVPRPRGLHTPGQNPPSMWRVWLTILAVALLMSWAMRGCQERAARSEKIAYTQFREHVRQGRVDAVTVKGEKISGDLVPAAGEPAGEAGAEDGAPAPQPFHTFVPSFGDDQLMPLLAEHGVTVSTEPTSDTSWWLVLVNLAPFLLLVGVAILVFSRMRSQGQRIFNIGRSQAREYHRDDDRTTFDDVAGCEGAKVELQEIIEFLRSPDRFRRLGGLPPKGVLLVGAPGTGKTLLARAAAGEADVPFFSITGSDFMEMFVGVGASRVRELFKDARRRAPSIVFIDELDSIGRSRGAGLGGGHDEREQTLNQLLSEMDGFEAHEGVIVMAATNRPDILDSALLRPGRFDRRVTVDIAGVAARAAILAIHARDKPLAPDVELEAIARGTPGFSGADLANLLNEAALLAARDDKDVLENADIDEARDKIMLGLRREGLDLNRDELAMIACHEAGHAIVAAATPGADPLHKVTITPRGRSLGGTHQLPDRDRYIVRREDLHDRLAVMMGGRAAELLCHDTATSGAEQDLQQATQLARRMVMRWGMSEQLPNLALDSEREHVFLGEELARHRPYSETTARVGDAAIADLVTGAVDRAREILAAHRDTLDRLIARLLDEEEVSGADVTAMLERAAEA